MGIGSLDRDTQQALASRSEAADRRYDGPMTTSRIVLDVTRLPEWERATCSARHRGEHATRAQGMGGPLAVAWPRAWPKHCVTAVSCTSLLHCHVAQCPSRWLLICLASGGGGKGRRLSTGLAWPYLAFLGIGSRCLGWRKRVAEDTQSAGSRSFMSISLAGVHGFPDCV